MTGYLIAHRLRRGLPALLAGGIVLGLALGLALSSFAAARDTASAYGRVLDAADAETAVVAHSLPPDEAAAVLDAQPAISRHRYQAGFFAYIEQADPALSGTAIASATDDFPLELPALDSGRLPDPDQADEVFINRVLADATGFEVGDELTLRVLSPTADDAVVVPITVTGIGILPREAVADETALIGIIVPTRAFYDEHEDVRLYSNSRVWLDDPRDLPGLARALSAKGMFISETRAQERRGVEDALGPTVTVLVALGLLASLGTFVLALQVAQRRQDRWRNDDAVLTALGSTRGARSTIHLASAAAEAVLAAATALAVMLLASPAAPVGPLHDLDPAQGVHLDGTVAAVGIVTLAVVLALVTLGLIYVRSSSASAAARPSRVTATAQRASSLAGLSLALRSRRRAGLRLAVASMAAAGLLAGVATVVVSARAVVEDPHRYGVNFDVLAFNAFGDQTDDGIGRAFGGSEVEASASFTNYPMLVEGRTVPGMSITPRRGELGPTMLEGELVRHDDEVVLGVDTAERLGVGTGDDVQVQSGTAYPVGPPPPPLSLRVVGLATFPAISQQGADEARLGVGALMTNPTFERLLGSDENLPEWTVATVIHGTDPMELVDANPDGVEDALGIATRWFTDARPAELVQLDDASPVLAGAVLVALLLLVTVVAQGAWARTRDSVGDLSVLQALGCSRLQLVRAAGWQAVPAGLAALAVGLPLGVAVGRLAFSAFARSIAVVDDPSSPPWLVAALALAVVASVGAGAVLSGQVARRVSSASTLRDADGRRA
ncbi:MAG: FtsX-like permease family protein [Acidimicrobiales bacterium]